MSLNQLLSKALHTRVSIVSSKGTFVRDQDFSRVYLNSTNFICEGKDIGDGMFVYRQKLKARANARNNTKHCWGKRSQQVTTCWVFRWEYKGPWDTNIHNSIHTILWCACAGANIVGCAVQTNATLLDHASMTAKQYRNVGTCWLFRF